jgi:hypothetical protein
MDGSYGYMLLSANNAVLLLEHVVPELSALMVLLQKADQDSTFKFLCTFRVFIRHLAA